MQIGLQGAFIAMSRLNDILEVDTEEAVYTGEKEPAIRGKDIVYKDIAFGYNYDDSILENVNIRFESGKSYALIGKSGCGKSTLMRLLLLHYQSSGGTELSSGQRQRIILARVLLAEPEVLVLDEATSHLDAESENKVFKFILDYTENITCICVSHNLGLMNLCDKIILMDQGKIISEN